MASTALIPKSAPFSASEIDALNSIMGGSSREQLAWLAGFFAGLSAAANEPQPVPLAPPRARPALTILFGSESGNAEGLAYAAKKVANKQGFDARVVDMADTELSSIADAKRLLVYTATWGEGDPPQRAADFYTALMSDSAPRLEGVKYAVLGLGDSAYVNFCETGRRIDARLEELGGTRIADRIDLDLDFSAKASNWTTSTLEALRPADGASGARVVHVDFQQPLDGASPQAPIFTSDAPLEAEITGLVNLNGSGSTRETWHVELATDAAGYVYKPGDAIGVIPENDPELVAALVASTGVDADPAFVQYLTQSADITTLSRPLIEKYAALSGRSELAPLVSDAEAFQRFAADRQLIDLFAEYPARLDAQTLKGLLRPLPSRLYSVASSQIAHEGETHLLVGAVRWHSHNRTRNGVASTFLADRRKIGDTLKLYVKANRHFRLPTDSSHPIIMIGAGTGIAPYRAFVAERQTQDGAGKSWLFFGERNFTHDFLYQLEWQDFIKSGALTRMDLAFSRDQPEKIYVQHRLWQRREEIRHWLADGAHLYVCGDEKGMARDVDETLVRILAEPEHNDSDAGKAALKALAKAGRYQRDVY
jgi:sulfite reductase (NADPH) flavoprotein alpha-component